MSASLTDQNTNGVPRREGNPSNLMTPVLVSGDRSTSRCTARVVEQVNEEPHIFSLDHGTVTESGPT